MQDENREEQTPVPGTEPAAPPVQPPAEPEEVVSWYVRPDRAREVQDCYVQPRPMPAAAIPKAEPEKKPHSRRGLWIFLIVLAVLVGTVLGVAVVTALRSGEPSDGGYDGGEDASSIVDIFGGDIPTIPRADIDPSVRFYCQDAAEEKLTIQQVYAAVNPATVLVVAEMGEKASIGTGVILTEDGYIVTNAHVIADGQSVLVVLADARQYEAELVGFDSAEDLAVLKAVDAEDLPTAVLGDSDECWVGDTVYAIGNPLGVELRGTLTDGIVSAINRDVQVDGRTMTLVQTNAALNSGNSGGPLINACGQVVGINTIKMSSDYSNVEGLGFAIPSASIRRLVNDLLTYGEVRPEPSFGVTVLQTGTRLEDDIWGLQVLEVTPGSAADLAGIREGDFVLAAGGRPVETSQELLRIRRQLYVGDQVTMEIWRDGERMEVTLTLNDPVE